MTEFVRVTADNGYHVTLPKGYAESRGLKILKESPVDGRGRPLPEVPASAAAIKAADEATATAAADNTPSGSGSAASTTEEK
jgi:hypothetical protein